MTGPRPTPHGHPHQPTRPSRTLPEAAAITAALLLLVQHRLGAWQLLLSPIIAVLALWSYFTLRTRPTPPAPPAAGTVPDWHLPECRCSTRVSTTTRESVTTTVVTAGCARLSADLQANRHTFAPLHAPGDHGDDGHVSTWCGWGIRTPDLDTFCGRDATDPIHNTPTPAGQAGP